MSRGHALVIGSGAGGSVAAWVLAHAGFEVTILEKGRNWFRGLDDPAGLALPLFGGDEIRRRRGFPGMDALAEPRSLRSQREAEAGVERSSTGDVNMLPATVGGEWATSPAAAEPGAVSRNGSRKAPSAFDFKLTVIVRTPSASAVWKSSTVEGSPIESTFQRAGTRTSRRKTPAFAIA